MRRILLLLLVSLPLFSQTVEVIAPPAIGEDFTATWTVVLTNPGDLPTAPEQLNVYFGGYPAFGELISVAPGCTRLYEALADCGQTSLLPRERRELLFTLRYDYRFGTFNAAAQLGSRTGVATFYLQREFAVTNRDDGGPGSLRQALLDMNLACTGQPEPCALLFRIPGPAPVEGWFTIHPSSTLPPLTAGWAIVDGRTQTQLTGDTNPAGPELMLDGSATGSGHGLQFDGGTLTVSDLAIGNFPGNGIASRATSETRIERCHLGMDPSGLRRAPNGTRGAQIEGGLITVTDSILGGNFRSGGWFDTNRHVTIRRNRFTDNGASGFYARTPIAYYNFVDVGDNVITGNAHAGISLSRDHVGNYAGNHFGGNLGRAIDIGIDGPTLAMLPGLPGLGGMVGAPVIVSAHYENGETVIQARVAPRSPNTFLGEVVHFYASTDAKDGGELLGTVVQVTDFGSDLFTLRVPRDLRGLWVSAATFARYVHGWDDVVSGTSEVGMPRLVE